MDNAQVAEKAGVDLLGEFHRFGPDGVVYEIVAAVDDERVEVRVVETGETLRYPACDVRRDPRA